VALAFAQLRGLVPPPAQPVEAADIGAFAAVEERLGLRLPSDYKCLVCAYGTGSWKNFLWVLSPFARRNLPTDGRIAASAGGTP
jgi:hypothetical protein